MKNIYALDFQTTIILESQTLTQINQNLTQILTSYSNSQIDENTCHLLLNNLKRILELFTEHCLNDSKKVADEILKRIKDYLSTELNQDRAL